MIFKRFRGKGKGDESGSGRVISSFVSSQKSPSAMPLTLEEYRAVVAQLPRPTEEQIEAFAEYVADAHSWYKHLPLIPPGRPFIFYLDPLAGMDIAALEDGRVEYLERKEGDDHVHYNWRPTAIYRREFGYLAYAAESGTMILQGVTVHGRDGRSTRGMIGEKSMLPVVFVAGDGHRPVPPEIAETGTVHLTGVIHPLGMKPNTWLINRITNFDDVDGCWPEVSGGQEVLENILTFCCRRNRPRQKSEISDEARKKAARFVGDIKKRFPEDDPPSTERWEKWFQAEWELEELLRPERERLFRTMSDAMVRVCDLALGGR